jgi:tetratricopeptide (TPR) repeat protein
MPRIFLTALLFSVVLRADTVLVVPFFNHSKAASLDWVGESIAETVRDALASNGVLSLERDDVVEAYRRLSLRPGAELTRASVIKLGELLDAGKVIYGVFDVEADEATPAGKPISKGSLKIRARILDLKRLNQSPEFSELGALEELASIESHLGWKALTMVAPRLAPSEQEFRLSRPSVKVNAVESYIRGLLATSAEQRHSYFTQSARLDAGYSQPRYRLGKIYWDKKEYKVAAGWLKDVRQSDPHYLEARYFLGLCFYHLNDFRGAEQSFEQVAASVPLNEVYNNLGAAQARRGMLAQAQANFRKALEGDSTDPDFHFNLGYALWKARQFDEAATSFRAVLDRSPADTEATTLLGRALKKDGPRPADPKTDGRERLKTNYDETTYRQLQAELESKK